MFFFFFKQKTAYEMRISDWSLDVCSSDLWPAEVHRIELEETERLHGEMRAVMRRAGFSGTLPELFAHVRAADRFYYPNTAEGKAAYLDAMRAKIAAVTARLGELTASKSVG